MAVITNFLKMLKNQVNNKGFGKLVNKATFAEN